MGIKNYGQFNIAHDNATINAIQIINYNAQDKPPKIMTPEPIPLGHYVLRDEEEAIITKLEENKLLFLNGIGGIGKTTTAKKIFERLKDKYDYLAWIEYRSNWQYSLVNGFFTSYFHFDDKMMERERYEKIIEFITNLQEGTDGKQNRVVIFIDNFNQIESGELAEIRRLPVHLLITTRCKMPGVEEYTLGVPDLGKCRQLFKANYTKYKQLTYRDEKAIDEIIQISHGYPLALELIAKAISYKHIRIEDFLQDLKAKNYKIEEMNLSANSDWNDPHMNEEIAKQISKVYALSDLGERESVLIKVISILPPNYIISNDDIQCCVPFNCTDTMIALSCRGWVNQAENGITMHEIVCECIYRNNSISYAECKMLLDMLELKTTVDSNSEIVRNLKYAKYAYNVINIMQLDINFCRHLFVKEAALLLKEVGMYTQSRKMLDIIIAAYDESRQDDMLTLAELHNNYSKILSMESNTVKALEESTHAEKLIDAITEDKSENYYLQRMVIKKTVATHYAHQKVYETALSKMQEALQCVDHIPNQEKYYIINLYSDYSMLLSDLGDMSGSIAQYEKVLKLYDAHSVKENIPWRYTTYTNLSDALIYDGQFILANNYEFQALMGKYQTYQEDNYAIANALLGMGHIYRSEKRLWDVAALFYRKASRIYQENINSDGYCDSLAGLSIVTDDISYAKKAYEIMLSNDEKTYLACTYTDVMCALLASDPSKVITLGIQMISAYSNQPKTHTAIQYAYALMGKASQSMGDNKNAELYLSKSNDTKNDHATYFYKAAQEIIDNMPSLQE